MPEDEDGEIHPVRTGAAGGKGEIKIDRLLAIIEEFNDLFGGIEWKDADRVRRMVTVDLPAMVAEDAKFRNARENSDRENARIEADKALQRAVLGIMNDDTQLFNSNISPTVRTSSGGWGAWCFGWLMRGTGAASRPDPTTLGTGGEVRRMRFR